MQYSANKIANFRQLSEYSLCLLPVFFVVNPLIVTHLTKLSRIVLLFSKFVKYSMDSAIHSVILASLVTHSSNIRILVSFSFVTKFQGNKTNSSVTYVIVEAGRISPKSVLYG